MSLGWAAAGSAGGELAGPTSADVRTKVDDAAARRWTMLRSLVGSHVRDDASSRTARQVFEATKADLRRRWTGPISLGLKHGCNCTKCKPQVYRKMLHAEDNRSNLYRMNGETDFAGTIALVRRQGLRFHRHDAMHLVSLTVASFEGGMQGLSVEQKAALAKWNEWVASAEAKTLCTMSPGDVPAETLQRAASILNDTFFLGQLPSTKSHVEWSEDLCPGVIGRSTPLDFHGKTGGHEHHSLCQLQPQSAVFKLDPKVIITVILHEMCHSFLARYACMSNAESECKSKLCEQMRWQNGRHGRAWQHLTNGVEDHMVELLGFGRSLGRVECLVREIRNFQLGAPRFQPSACETKKLFPRDEEAVVVASTICKSRAVGDQQMWKVIQDKAREKWFTTYLKANGGRKRRCSV